jgi:hypothetical protein
MKHRTILKTAVCCTVLLVLILALPASAQTDRPRRGGIYGDWQVKMQFGEREFESILSFSRNQERQWTGQWISFWGLSELKDVQFAEGKLSFTQERQNREGQTMTSKFTGTILEGKLTGTLSSDRGDTKVEGQRSVRMPRAVGNWEMKYKIGEREITTTMAVKVDKEGKLIAEWQSERGEHVISDLQYERGSLSFKRKSTMGERQWESTFEGTLQRDTLSGTFKSERGDIAVEASRMGVPLIGTWILDISSEFGDRKQRLLVNRDMSGLYGAIPVKKIDLKEDQVSFKIVMEFGEQKFEMDFAGKMKEQKLTGELKTSRGTSKITGKKVIRTFRRRPPAASQPAATQI